VPFKRTIILPNSTRQVKKHLKPPLSNKSAVVYFTRNGGMPFLLDSSGGGYSPMYEFRLKKDWRLSKDKLKRIVIITVEEFAEETRPEGQAPLEENTRDGPAHQEPQ
jgi:hypothetical protein